MPTMPFFLCLRCCLSSCSKKRACSPYSTLQGVWHSVRAGPYAPVNGVAARAIAGGVTGLQDKVALHVVDEAVVVILDPGRAGCWCGGGTTGFALAQLEKVLCSNWTIITKQVDDDIAFGCLKDDRHVGSGSMG